MEGDVVKNTGTKANSDGRLVAGPTGGVEVSEGRLKLTQSAADIQNGFFELPSDMFEGLTAFTFNIDVNFAWVNDTQASLFHFTKNDPRTGVEDNEANDSNIGEVIEASWGWVGGTTYYNLLSSPWDAQWETRLLNPFSYTTPNGNVIMKDFTLTVVWNGSAIDFYMDGMLCLSSSISAENVQALRYNRIGGAVYAWGRHGAFGIFDNVELYDYAMTEEEVAAFSAIPAPLIEYDFSEENIEGATVKNIGSKADSDAVLLGSKGGKLEGGKLIFERFEGSTTSVSTDSSYLELPSDMFAGQSEFTLSIDVDHADLTDYTNKVFYFTQNDPLFTSDFGNKVGIWWCSEQGTDGWHFYLTQDSPEALWGSRFNWDKIAGVEETYADFRDAQFTLSLVYSGGRYYIYWDDVAVWRSNEWEDALPSFFETLVVNRLGGYTFDWGRSATCGEYDNFRLYDRALSASQLKTLSERSYTDVVVTGGGEVVAGRATAEAAYTLPETWNAEGTLLGYICDGVFLKPGAQIAMDGNAVRAKAVLAEFAMRDGAGVRIAASPEQAGLRFMTVLDIDYAALTERGTEEEIAAVQELVAYSAGTLITREDYLQTNGEISFENYTVGTDVIDISAAKTYEQEGKLAWNAAIVNLKQQNYARKFAARSYLTVTYSDGTQATYYTAFSAEKNARSASEVAAAALADTSAGYTEAERELLRMYTGENEEETV